MPIMQKKLVFFKKKPMEIAALLIPMYTLAIGLRWPQIGQIFLLYRYVSITICLLLSLQVIKHHNILQTKVFVCIVLLQVILIATTLINNPANIIYSIQLAIYAIIPFFILSFFSIKINLNTICEGILLSLEILVVTNFIIMMIFPRGFYSTESSNTITAYYLFGSKNQMVAPVMTCIFFEFENMRLKNRFIFSKILICLMCIFELIIGGSGTGITLLITFFALAFLQMRGITVSPNKSIFVIIFLYLGFVILRIQNIFSFFIVNILHKSLTLSDRTIIWDFALEKFLSHWLTGTGVESQLTAEVEIHLDYANRTLFAHNMVLDYLLMGGILSGIILFLILYYIKESYCHFIKVTHMHSFIWLGLFIYLIASMVDIYPGQFCLFLLIAYITCSDFYVIKKSKIVKN